MSIFNRKNLLYAGLGIIAVLVLYGLYSVRRQLGEVLFPFILAIVIAYMLNPLVKILENRKISRSVSILMIYVVVLGLLGVFSFFIIPEIINNIMDLIYTLPDYFTLYQTWFSELMNAVQASRWSEDIKNSIVIEAQNNAQLIQNTVINTLKRVLNLLMGTFSVVINFFLALVIAFYFIRDIEAIKKSAFFLIPRKWRNASLGTIKEINDVLTRFIQGQLTVALAVGLFETVGLSLIGIKYALVLGLVGGMSNIIPYFGPFIGAVPAVAIGLLDPHPIKALWAALVFVAVQQIDNAFISPKIMQHSVGLHPVTTIFVVMAGGRLFGIVGLLLAVPFTAILKIIVKKIVEKVA